MRSRIVRNDEDGNDEEMIICGISYADVDTQVYELNRGIGLFSKWRVAQYDISRKSDYEDFEDKIKADKL